MERANASAGNVVHGLYEESPTDEAAGIEDAR